MTPIEWNDADDLYGRVLALKDRNPSLKVLLAVGGWNHEDGHSPFSDMVSQDSSMQTFINSAMSLLRDHTFDGLDLDWEYPAQRTSPAGDKQKFTILCQELREAFALESINSGKPHLLLLSTLTI